jgi:hypothetical protein
MADASYLSWSRFEPRHRAHAEALDAWAKIARQALEGSAA